jgi:hypothetical protein
MAVDQPTNPDDPSPSLHPHYRASSLLRDGPPLCPASLRLPSRFPPLGVLAWRPAAGQCRTTGQPPIGTTGSHVPHRSQNRTRATSMPDTAWPVGRHPPGSSRDRYAPRFRCRLRHFDTSSVVHSRSPSRLAPDALTARLFPQCSAPRLLTDAPCGGLQPPPAGRLRRATRPTDRPPSPMQHRIKISRSSTSILLICVRGHTAAVPLTGRRSEATPTSTNPPPDPPDVV